MIDRQNFKKNEKNEFLEPTISNLSSGIYMVKIQTAEGTYTNKIIKN